MSIEVLISAGLGALQALILWILKDIKKSQHNQDRVSQELAKDLSEVKVAIAEQKGEKKGESDLVWRELNSEKHKIVKMEGKVDAVWSTVERLAEKAGIVTRRASDEIKR